LSDAFATRDLRSIAELLAPDLRFSVAGTRSSGRDSAVAALTRLVGPADSANLGFGPEQFDRCQLGAVEWGGQYTLTLYFGRDSVRAVRGRYAIGWAGVGGDIQINAIALAALSSAPPRVRCPQLAPIARYRRARVVFEATMPGGGVGGMRTGPSITEYMESQGYAEGNVGAPERVSSDGGVPALLSARLKPFGPIWLEFITTSSVDLNAYRIVNNGFFDDNWHVQNSARAFTALASVEARFVRVGAGLGLVRSKWRGGYAGWYTPWTTDRTGLALGAGLSYPVTSRFVVHVRGLSITGPRDEIPAFGPAPVVPVAHQLWWASVGLGLTL
jgi:hypothetical protein